MKIDKYTRNNPQFRQTIVISYFFITILSVVYVYNHTGWFFALLTTLSIGMIYCLIFIWLFDYWDTFKTSGMLIASILKSRRKNNETNK